MGGREYDGIGGKKIQAHEKDVSRQVPNLRKDKLKTLFLWRLGPRHVWVSPFFAQGGLRVGSLF